ncbi:MAG: guanylate kinase [Sedimentisphaerales bacterium]|nr:guanylate kinase [Sedimentisphaerales bacterium]
MIQARDQEKPQGRLVVVSGPSGVGKSTICREVVKRLDNAFLSVSVTTRPRGPREENGREYWFISREEFRTCIENGTLLEYAEVFGNLYGTPKDKTDEALHAGKDVILEIDIQGGRQVKAVYPQAVMIFILPPSVKILAERVGHRGRETAEAAARRLGSADAETTAAREYYDHMVVNDDLEQAITEVIRIIEQAPGLAIDD